MPAIFQLSSTDTGQYRFELRDNEGECLLLSDNYADVAAAELAIQDVRVGSLMNEQISKGQTDEGKEFFVIKNSSGSIIAKSALYENDMQFANALHQVKDNACVAEIVQIWVE